mgnify:FL=1
MLNILIADDNIDYAVNLMNYINEQNNNIKVCNIAKNGKETLEILNFRNDIDVILLDYKMPFYNGEQVLEKIINKNRYEDSFIIISGEIESVIKLRENVMIHSIIYKTTSMYEIIRRINELFEYKETMKKSNILKRKITEQLLYIGYDVSHKGTQYLIKVIEYIKENENEDIKGLEKNIYPIIAKRCSNSAHNIKCNINRATTAMYYECDSRKLQEYFSFNADYKPKIKTIIDTIIRKIA